MRKAFSITACVFAAISVSGCVGGTTYGTGVSHEKQTMEGLKNIVSLKSSNDPKINYAARPDLVMPGNVNSLPQPVDEIASVEDDANWPETPEQRIARIQNEAVQPHERSGQIPVQELVRKKEGIKVASKPRVFKNPDRDGNDFIDSIRDDANGVSASSTVRKRREELAYSTGVQRKFLTEPPVEYRTPAATAVAGDLGYSREELAALEAKRKKREEAEKKGHWIE